MLGVAPNASRYRTNNGAVRPLPAAIRVLHIINVAVFFFISLIASLYEL